MENNRAKVCVIGPDGAGKTSILIRYTKNTFSNSYLATLGCDFYEINFEKDSKELHCCVWDIAAQKHFELFRRQYLLYANLIIICTDIYRYEPEILDPWISYITELNDNNAEYFFVINKLDLLDNRNKETEIISNLKKKYKKPIFFTSAKTGENIQMCFQTLRDSLWSKFNL